MPKIESSKNSKRLQKRVPANIAQNTLVNSNNCPLIKQIRGFNLKRVKFED